MKSEVSWCFNKHFFPLNRSKIISDYYISGWLPKVSNRVASFCQSWQAYVPLYSLFPCSFSSVVVALCVWPTWQGLGSKALMFGEISAFLYTIFLSQTVVIVSNFSFFMLSLILYMIHPVDLRLKWTNLLRHFIHLLIQREQDGQPWALEQSCSQSSVQGIGELVHGHL